MPGSAEIHIASNQRAVDEVLVLVAGVFAVGNPVHLFQCGGRHEGEGFLAVRVERVQHAVVGADVDARGPALVRILEGGIGTLSFQGIHQIGRPGRGGDHHRCGADDVAEKILPAAKDSTLFVAVTTQVIDSR
ncbi:hypothetical protein D9M71_717100 [compost metagenome]